MSKSYNSINTAEHASLLRRNHSNKDGKLRTMSTLFLALAIIMVSIVILIGNYASSKSCVDNSDNFLDQSPNIFAQLPPQEEMLSIHDVSFTNNCTHFIYFDEVNGEYTLKELSTKSSLQNILFVLSSGWAEHTIPIGASNFTFSICLKRIEPVSFCKFYIYTGNYFEANANLHYTVKYKKNIESTISNDLPHNQIIFGTQDIISVGDCYTIKADFSQSGENGFDTLLQYIQFNVSRLTDAQPNASEYRQFMNVKCETHKTVSPTPYPSHTPTTKPTPLPTVKPSFKPTPLPTIKPTFKPTPLPTLRPSSFPTIEPTTPLPTSKPSLQPTTHKPTQQPTPVCMACCPDIRFIHQTTSFGPNVSLLMHGSYGNAVIHQLNGEDYKRCGANGCDIEIKTTNCSKKNCSKNSAYTLSNDILTLFTIVLFSHLL